MLFEVTQLFWYNKKILYHLSVMSPIFITAIIVDFKLSLKSVKLEIQRKFTV